MLSYVIFHQSFDVGTINAGYLFSASKTTPVTAFESTFESVPSQSLDVKFCKKYFSINTR